MANTCGRGIGGGGVFLEIRHSHAWDLSGLCNKTDNKTGRTGFL